MKLAVTIILATCLQVSATGHSQETRLTLKMKQVPISRVLKTIEQQTDYKFVYSNNLFPSHTSVNIDVKNMLVSDILLTILDHTDFTYKKIDKDLIVITKKMAAIPTASAWITIKGKVTNAKGEGLASVTITVENGNVSATTNAEGEFIIDADGSATLIFSSAEYIPQRVQVNNRALINVTLMENVSSLHEVVIIGYGQRMKKDLTGSISSISASDIGKSTSPTAQLALQGRMAGVFVSTPSGNPNERPVVRIRGINSFNPNSVNDPLYVIDGIPMTEGGSGSATGTVGADLRTPINIFTIIDPSDIESISVLKDASAAAIYGVRASNGVVLITTKRGKAGKARIEVNGYYGIQNTTAKLPRLLTTPEYVTLYNEAYNNNPNISGGNPVPIGTPFGAVWNPASPQYLGNSPTYNWYNAYLNKEAPVRDLNVKISGANEGTNYYVSTGYFSTEGSIIGSNLERYSLATNINTKFSKLIEAGITTRLVYQKNRNHLDLGDLSTAMTAPPWQALYGNGPKGFAPTYSYAFTPNPSFNPTLISSGSIYNSAATNLYGLQTRLNPLGLYSHRNNTYHDTRALGNAYLQLSPVKGLKIRGTLGGDYLTIRHNNYSEFLSYLYNPTGTNPWGRDSTVVASSTIRQTFNKSITGSLNAIYNFAVGKHSFEVLADASQQKWSWDILTSGGSFFYPEPNLQFTLEAIEHSRGSIRKLEKRILIGYVGRVSYKYDDKYYFDATLRRDGSSRFAPGRRWGMFPSFAAAWRISDEKFFPVVKWLNDLKIRANWGKLGNEQNTEGWAFLSLINPGISVPDYPLGSGNGNGAGINYSGVYMPAYPNRELSWETAITSGAGFDAVLFDNKMNLTFEYYNRLNTDIIVPVAAPPSTGIELPTDRNVGEVRNRGIELTIGYNGRIGPVQFSASGNITTVSNKVMKIYNGLRFSNTVREGYPMNFLYGYQFGGVFQSQAEIDAWRTAHVDLVAGSGYIQKPGDAYFLDINSPPLFTNASKFNNTPDGLVSEDDQTYLGKTIPGYHYGFNFSAAYKGIDLSVFFQGVGDVQRYNTARAAGEAMSSTGVNQWATVSRRWTPQNPSTVLFRAAFGDPGKNNRLSSLYVEDAGFLRLKNLQLGYTIPGNILARVGFITSCRVYLSGVNLFTITPYSGLDPENDFNPPVKQVLFGFNLNF